jgi:hypothetical protein
MKRTNIVLLLSFSLPVFITGDLWAQTAKEIFSSRAIPVTYLGVDFTQVRVLGEPNTTANDMRNTQFPAINNVILNEPRKYDIPTAIQKSNVSNDLSFVTARNKKTDVTKIKSTKVSDYNRLARADIDKLAKEYQFNGKKGIGFLFIMECLNQVNKTASLYVAFIDMDTKKVLFTERLEAKAQGFGFRNYWAYSIADALQQIEKTKYKEWQLKNQ